jgi:hypothetical protein
VVAQKQIPFGNDKQRQLQKRIHFGQTKASAKADSLGTNKGKCKSGFPWDKQRQVQKRIPLGQTKASAKADSLRE